MDDPWGSPWASTDAQSKNDATPSLETPNDFLSPPPRAFFGTATNQTVPSPWASTAEDDAFGAWSTADRTDVPDIQTEWGGWGETTLQIPRPSPRLSVSSKDGSIAWPNATASPRLKGDSRSRSPSIFRQPSPDPWAAEVSLSTDIAIETTTKSKENLSHPPVDQPPRTSSALPTGSSQDIAVKDKSSTPPATALDQVKNNDDAQEKRATTGEADDNSLTRSNILSEPDKEADALELHSRSPSNLSIDSHADPDRSDSPITSIDEDRGTRLRIGSRKISGKVHELVGLYDGLTRANSEEPPSIEDRAISQTRSRNISRARPEQKEGGDGEFGEFGDADIHDQQKAPIPSIGVPVAQEGVSKNESHAPQSHGPSPQEIQADSSRMQTVFEQFCDISFHPDLTLIDKLFPEVDESLDINKEDTAEISDQIIRDTFTSISERKAWYRISRFGSMRRHNFGDEDNYHVITWATSQLRSDTIKIVRRWMEEDTYSGRAILGGSKRTSFFDWDSNAAPITLAEVFKRKPSDQSHGRTLSTPTNNVAETPSIDEQLSRNSTGISNAAELSFASQPANPAINFGWNSSDEPRRSSSQRPTPSQLSSQLDSPPLTSPLPATLQTTIADEDEDDWGEMVSSPRIGAMHTADDRRADTGSPLKFVEAAASVESMCDEPEKHNAGTAATGVNATQPITTIHQSSSSSGARDSLQLADFSFFDDLRPSSQPKRNGNADMMRVDFAHNGELTQNVAKEPFSAPTKLGAEPPPETPIPSNRGEEDAIIQRILRDLPDFSYMLH